MPWQTTWLIEMQQLLRVAAIAERRRDRAGVEGHLVDDVVELLSRDAGDDVGHERVEDLRGEAAGAAHALEPFGAVQLDDAVLGSRRSSGATVMY